MVNATTYSSIRPAVPPVPYLSFKSTLTAASVLSSLGLYRRSKPSQAAVSALPNRKGHRPLERWGNLPSPCVAPGHRFCTGCVRCHEPGWT